jgi:hypothetical protein
VQYRYAMLEQILLCQGMGKHLMYQIQLVGKDSDKNDPQFWVHRDRGLTYATIIRVVCFGK